MDETHKILKAWKDYQGTNRYGAACGKLSDPVNINGGMGDSFVAGWQAHQLRGKPPANTKAPTNKCPLCAITAMYKRAVQWVKEAGRG